jgi:hypothetical protein
MRQRKTIKKKELSLQERQEKAYTAPKEREWLKKQIELIGRGKHLLQKKTVRTPLVKETAIKLTTGKPALSAAKTLVNYVSNPKKIQLIHTGWETVSKFYNKQTAADVLKTGRIPTIYNIHGEPLIGCNTVAATLTALLRSANPSQGKINNVKVIRTISPQGIGKSGKWLGMPHTIVYFKINGKGFVADAFGNRGNFFNNPLVKNQAKNMIEEEKISKAINILKKQGDWKEALDPQEFALNDLKDFIAESRKKGSNLAEDLNLRDFLRRMN